MPSRRALPEPRRIDAARLAPFAAARFTIAAAGLDQLPADRGLEVAFAGRSNAGKSSVINRLTGRRALARTSRTPGRTQQIVFFELDATRRLADLPGYGYARVPAAVRAAWGRVIERYLRQRRCLAGIVIVMDARHPFTALDLDMLAFGAAAGRPLLILLNKSDKLSNNEAQAALAAAHRQAPGAAATLFSAATGRGLDTLVTTVEAWLDLPATIK